MTRLGRLSIRLLRWFMDGPSAASIVGDLEEERHRSGHSRLWLLLQAITICGLSVSQRASSIQPHIVMRSLTGNILHDVRYAFRILVANRTFTAVAVLALTLAIGAMTTVFSVMDATVFGDLPLPESDRIYHVRVQQAPGTQLPGTLMEEYEAWKDRKDIFEAVSPWVPTRMQLPSDTGPELLEGMVVPLEFFDLVGVKPAIGRAFLPEEDRPSGPPVVILAYGVWQRLFGGDAGIIGRSVQFKETLVGSVSPQLHTIVGVMPQGFAFPNLEPQLLVPLNQDISKMARINPIRIFARLKSGLSETAALAALMGIEGDLEQRSRDLYAGRVPVLVPIRQFVTGPANKLPVILMSAVAFVLLIAVVNVANLMLGHASGRTQEIAVRFSVGASRWRIIRQLISESLLLAVISGIAALACTAALTEVVAAVLPAEVPLIHPVRVDWRVAAFALAASILSGALFGLYPACNASCQSVADALKQGRQLRLGRFNGQAVRAMLTIVEVALAMILCAGAGLLLKSFVAYLHIDNGVNANNVAMLQIPAEVWEFKNSMDLRIARYRRIIEAATSVPGVAEAAVTSNIPLIERAAGFGTRLSLDNHPFSPGKIVRANTQVVTPQYFSIMGLPIIHGRAFTDSDTTSSLPVAIVDESTAARFWPGQDPIGKRLGMKTGSVDRDRTYTVVGIAKNVKKTEYEMLLETSKTFGIEGLVYLPFYGSPIVPGPQNRFLVVRSQIDPRGIVPELRKAIIEAEPNQAIAQIDFFDDVLEKDRGAPRFRAFTIGAFAAIALLISIIGVYGVVSHSVTTRMHEMGVRLVMGARESDILRLIVGQGFLLVLMGILLGVVGSLALTRVIEAYLFRTEAIDGATFAASAGLFSAAALIACWLPARRASHANPVSILRGE